MQALSQVLARTIRHNGDSTAILDGDLELDYRMFGARVARAAGVLAALGIGPGDRYAIYARNGARFEELKWAGFQSGAVSVPINWRLAPQEVAHILSDASCRAVFVDDEFVPAFEADSLRQWNQSLVLLSTGDPGHGWPSYDDLYAAAEPVPCTDRVDADDDAILIYTAGTTGPSKGVRLSHTNIVSNSVAFGLAVQARPDDIFLHVAPMFHSSDLLATVWFMLGGGHCYLPDFTPQAFLGVIERHRVTSTIVVPAILIATLPNPAFAQADISSLRTLVSGGAPLDAAWVKRTAEAMPHVEFSNCYGLTEASPEVTVSDPRAFRAAIEGGDTNGPVAAVGKPNVFNELRIVGSDGAEMPAGEPGELWVRGPNITKGYLNRPEETAAAIEDGWLKTGDIARIDEEGYLYLLDRKKDMIITGGENVYSSEVEAALYQHPAVHECAVIGIKDERLGEALFAVIVPRPGTAPSEDDIIAHCRTLIGGYKIPRRMVFVPEMPKSAMGKILKTELRQIYDQPGTSTGAVSASAGT